LRDGAPDDRIHATVQALADFHASFVVERVHVLQGEHGVWTPTADFAFGGVAVRGRGSLDLEIAESDRLDPGARDFAERVWRAHDEARFGSGTRWERHPYALTARVDGRVVGVATGWTGLGVGYLSELVVADDARGQGIGSHLLAAFESLAALRACARVALRTDAGSRAVAFYEARGWLVEATFTGWLGGADFVQMRRDLA
jgi:GNAT superfamily N-acetyltransferase